MYTVNDYLISLLVDPYSKDELKLYTFNRISENIIQDGILFNENTKAVYPIINKVPILIKNHLLKDFYNRYQNLIDNIVLDANSISNQILDKPVHFSFSKEWEQFSKDKMSKTWGFTAEERLAQFYEEVKVSPEEIVDKIILDAGCGNGLLTTAISKEGAYAIGIDYSDSVFNIANANSNKKLLFVKGDLCNSPFKENTFDIIISNGVIHHTKSTKKTFQEVAKLTKQGGKFYLWLYKRPHDWYMSIFIYTTDFLRFFVNKLPHIIQRPIVNLYASFFFYLKKIKNKNVMEFDQLRIDAYDTLTPKYKHYHHPIEVAEWFFENGYDLPVLSHWDNPYGFGIMSIKNPQKQTPGIHYKLKK